MASFLFDIGLKLQKNLVVKTVAIHALSVKHGVVHEFLYNCKADDN